MAHETSRLGEPLHVPSLDRVATDSNFIVCGWYTPDYAHWVMPLRARLDALGVPHDFVEVPKRPGGWEANTNQKPAQVLAAMGRHPETTLLFLDVDCQVLGSRADIDALVNIAGDVGVHLRGRFRRGGQYKLHPRTGTLVIRPTQAARGFLQAWEAMVQHAPPFTSDQAVFAVALGQTPGVSVTALPTSVCAIPADRVDAPLILHARGRTDRKKSRVEKVLYEIFKGYGSRPGPPG